MKDDTKKLLADWRRWAITGPLNHSTATAYHHLLWDFFSDLRWKAPDRVRPRDVTSWAVKLQARGKTMPWAGHKALHSFYRFLWINGHAIPNASDYMPYKEPSIKVPESFSPLDLDLIFKAASALPDPRIRPAFELLYHTGARRSELSAVKAENISSTHITLFGKSDPGGLKKARSVPLNPVSQQAVLQLLNAPRPHQHASSSQWRLTLLGTGPAGIGFWCRDVSALVGFRVHAHKFRATFATNLLRSGVDVRIVQQLMGHATLNTTMRYLATTDELLVSAVARLAG